MNTDIEQTERKSKLTKTIIYYACFVALGLTTASMGPTLPGLAANTHSDIQRISYLFVVRSLGYLLGSLQAGRIYDRVKGNPVMALALGVMSITLILIPVINLLVLLAVVLFVLGFAEGTLDVGGNTVLVWLHRDKVAPFMNGLHFFFGLGAFFCPIIIAQTIAAGKGITWAYWILAVLVFPAALFTVRMPSPPSQIHDMQGPIKPARPWLIFLAATFFFLYVGAEVAFGGWLYTYAISLNLGSATTAAYFTSAFWGSFTAGRLLSIPLAARMHPRAMLIIDLVGCIASLLLPLFFPGSSTVLWICTIGTGLFMASIFPTMLNLAQSFMTMTGRITSWFFVGASVGGMILPWFIGQLFEPVGPQVVIVVITAFMLVAGLVLGTITAWVAKASSPTPSEETPAM